MKMLRSLSEQVFAHPLFGWVVLGVMLFVAFTYEPSSCSSLHGDEHVRCMDAAAENPGRPW